MSKTNPQVTRLVQDAQQGDLKSFEKLITLYQNKIYTLSLQLAGNEHDASDLAQEVFIKAYRYIGSFRLEADFGTWLHRIAVNTWLNTKKKMQRQVALSLDAPIAVGDSEVYVEVAAATGDPLQAVEKMEFQQEIREALQRLSEEHRTVLVLREIHGHSYDEIAEMLDCTLGTVKSRINRARQAMANLLRR